MGRRSRSGGIVVGVVVVGGSALGNAVVVVIGVGGVGLVGV